MSKKLIFIVLMGCVLVGGSFWADSMLSLPSADCRCRDYSDMQSRCNANCFLNFGSTCDGIITEPYGTCIDLTCWTFFHYLCSTGQMGTDLSDSQYCLDCYEY